MVEKLVISQRAAVQRIRRELAKSGQQILSWGSVFAIIDKRGRGAERRVESKDLESYARELGVLKTWEQIAKR